MTTKHTPGNWRVGYSDGSGMHAVTTTAKREFHEIAVVRHGCSCCRDTSPLTDEEKANLQLIAAAPKILKALKGMICCNCREQIGYSNERSCKECREARAAITSATKPSGGKAK